MKESNFQYHCQGSCFTPYKLFFNWHNRFSCRNAVLTSSCSTSRSMLAVILSTVRMDVIFTTKANILSSENLQEPPFDVDYSCSTSLVTSSPEPDSDPRSVVYLLLIEFRLSTRPTCSSIEYANKPDVWQYIEGRCGILTCVEKILAQVS